MKHIKNRKNHLLAGIFLCLSAALCLFFMLGMSGRTQAAETVIGSTADYSVKVTEGASSGCKVIFESTKDAQYVIAHYKVNNGDGQNVGMTGSGKSWELSLGSAKSGDIVEISFTYNVGTQYDSEVMTYTVGSSLNTRIEAESYTSMSGVVKEGTQIRGLGANDWMRYQMPVSEAGKYRIAVHGKSAGASDGKIIFRDENGRIASVGIRSGGSDFANYDSETFELTAGEKQLTAIVVAGDITVDWFELRPVQSGGNRPDPGLPDDTEFDPEIPTEVEPPEQDTTIEKQKDKIIFQLNNKTGGKYSDDQIYWSILGYDWNTGKLCYVDAQGNLIPATADLNTIQVGDRMCAKIYNTLAENKHVYMPSIQSGRMYISYGEPVYITINQASNGVTGFAGPDLNNPGDPNAHVLFEFMEFTIGSNIGKENANAVEYWGNTTRVDNFCFPVVTRLIGENGEDAGKHYDVFDKMVGDLGSRAALFAKFKSEAPDEFKDLAETYRIIAPCKGSFNEGKENGDYFQSYIDAFWDKYSREDLQFECEGGKFTARVNGDVLNFTEERSKQTGTVKKPNTQEVLEGKGAFDSGSSIEKVLEAQLCAAFNRGVALHPENWYKPEMYYQDSSVPCNYYSKFWHEHSVNGHAYGFCYDDVFDQATLLHFTNPTSLIIDLRW